ncbi:MAG: Asp-tRNA(Asn)/Glu-tRNA(Gln) amidotransferase subunit GatB [Calditrichaceae bacterium]|nr:Asp-tRNA(Asn)/Glu-tRNA(Gln) amidotransferase subunit GatB [Calditrichaceae bacterium]
MKYEAVIGLEVHAQLSTKSKIFCSCSTAFGAEPNTQTCPVCLGMPGVLPVLNKKVVEYAVRLGLATNSEIRRRNIFARKNYFYPDLPKGYQVSQFDEPICEQGYVDVEIDGITKRVGLTRIHMEEDAGKSVHDESYVNEHDSFVDLNRCGVPLLEIVSEPDIRSAKEAAFYLTKLRQMVRYLGICDGNMEEGSLRCDANVSIRPKGETSFNTRTELKNMNSINNVEKAIEYEIDRQIGIVESGDKVIQETLLWDPDKNEARSMRSKEESHDYRYFPEPDLVPVEISLEWLDDIQKTMPEMAEAKKARFISEYGLSEYNAGVLTSVREIAEYFEQTVELCEDYNLACNWIMGEVMRVLNERKINISELPVTPPRLAALLKSIRNNVISGSAAKNVFQQMLLDSSDVSDIIEKLGLKQISDTSQLDEVINKVLERCPEEVKSYKEGNIKVIGFLVGQVMKDSGGKANPKLVNEILRNKLA